jgi:hypothetical protein
MRSSRTAVFLLLAIAVRVVNAAEDYICTIERLSLASGDAGARYDLLREVYAGKQFSVERSSGLITGVLKNSYRTKPQVIDRGSNKNSYKVVTTMTIEQGFGAGSNVSVLVVNEYEPGVKKPFVFLQNEAVYLGRCEHF